MNHPPAHPPLRLAILGAAGLAGEALVRALGESSLAVASLSLLGGGKALGRTLEFRDEELGVTPGFRCWCRA